MLPSAATERREDTRYLTVGSALIETEHGPIKGELVNVGCGGMLVFCEASWTIGEQVAVRFTVEDYPLLVQVCGHVVHTAVGLVGIGFTEDPDELDEILLWLEAKLLACLI